MEPDMTPSPAIEASHDKPVLSEGGVHYLRTKIKERGTTITTLAGEVGVSRKHLSNVLNGRAPLIDPLLGRLCRALGVERSFLVSLLDDGLRPEPAPHGFMKGSIVWHDDLTAPMEDWEMLED